MFIKGMSFINYKKFKEPTELSLEEFTGRIGILGNNGTGKSTLLDVVPISLYGVDAVTGKKEHLRTQGLEKDLVKLRLDFEHGGKHFIIEREFKGVNLTPKAAIFEVIDEVPHLLASSAKDVNKTVTNILNMDYSTFIATVFCKQKELSRISSMLPTERRAFILKLSKVDDIDDDIKKCRELKRDSDKYVNMLMGDISSKESILEEINQLDKDIKVMKSEHKGALSKLGIFEEALKKAEVTKRELDSKYEAYNELTLELKDTKNAVANTQKDIDRLSIEKEDLLKLETYIQTEGNPLIEKHKSLQQHVESFDKIRPKFLEKIQLEKTIASVKVEGTNAKSVAEGFTSKINELGYDKNQTPIIEQDIKSLELEIDDIKSSKTSISGEIKTIMEKGTECKSEIKKIKDLYNENSNSTDDCKCPMCKQSVSKEHTDIVEKHYTEELKKLTSQYQSKAALLKETEANLLNKLKSLDDTKIKLKNQLDLERKYNDILAQLNAAKQQYNAKVSEYKTLMAKYNEYSDVNFDEKAYEEVKKEYISSNDKTRQVYIALDKVKKLPDIQNSLTNLEAKLKSETDKQSEIITKGKALNFDREQYSIAKTDYEKAFNDLNGVKEETSHLINEINSKDVTERKFLKDKLANVKEKEKEYNKHKNSSKDFSVIEEALINTKADIMSKINPLINKHFSEIFKTLMNEKYDDVELDENYNIVIYDCGEAFPLSRFSGGEQDLCNLSLRLAVSKFLAELNSGSIEFIVLDEIFASLDDDRKSALIDVLGNLNQFFRQIFIISHEDVIKSSLDHYLTVKENEYRYSEIEF